MVRRAARATKPSTNSGTMGGRFSPSPASALLRWCSPAAATMGASRITRVSLTTTATASADAPAVCAVATTWPTSCTDAPAQAPKTSGLSPSGCDEQRQHADGEGAAQGHEGHREHGVVLPDPAHRGHRPDRRGPADGKAGGDQQRHRRRQPEQPADAVGSGERGQDHARDQQQRGPAESKHVDEADLQAQDHDPGAHQVLAGEIQARPALARGPAGQPREIRGEEPERHGQRHGREHRNHAVDGEGQHDGGGGGQQARQQRPATGRPGAAV